MDWVRMEARRPAHGQFIWLFDSMFGMVTPWIVTGDPAQIDGDWSHWMPREKDDSVKPDPPADAKIHANLSNLPREVEGLGEMTFPDLPPAIHYHPELGPLFDRMQMHMYAVTVLTRAEAVAAAKEAQNAKD